MFPSVQHYFNPLPPHGGRPTFPFVFTYPRNFNPLPPHGGRRDTNSIRSTLPKFQSTPSAWRETPEKRTRRKRSEDFNPLPPHGGRLCVVLVFPPDCTFQSTPSAWRETLTFDYCRVSINHFNPLPPHGGRLGSVFYKRPTIYISIHSLRMEGDRKPLV